MPFPLAPHHVHLIAACYPPSSALISSAPEYKPNSQELSRLTYYASNRPGKITKLGSELEKRALADARKASGGNIKARASLLITLNIFKALTQECRRDLSLLSASLMSTLDSTLALLPIDLEIAAKVATVFAAWATYTTGKLLGIDQALTRDYVSTLRRFSSMCLFEAKDTEDRNRMRIIGLGALTGAVASEALYNSSSQFKPQASAIVPALFINLLQVDISVLDYETESSRDSPPLTTFLADFRSRPLLERRAASIHVHVDGDEGPKLGDVANIALKAFACLLGQSNGSQVTMVLQAIMEGLGLHDGWKHIKHCCWFIRKAIEWTQYQYRFAVPTRLIDKLMEAQEDTRPSDLHKTLVAMIRAAFTAPVPLVNLSTSDVCSNLTALILRRIAISPNDELLSDLVGCVGALGTHIYYADQIHDLACEIIGRLTHIESNGINGRGRADEGRDVALRCLMACIGFLIQSSTKPSHQYSASVDGHTDDGHRKHGAIPTIPANDHAEPNSPRVSSDAASLKLALPQRSRIPPDVWQETLSLLCDESFAVRSEYARVLVLYLTTEIRPEMGTRFTADGIGQATSPLQLQEGPLQRARTLKSVGRGESPTCRFLHALQATIYVLATSSELGLPPSSPPSPVHSSDDGHDHGQYRRHDPVRVNITPSTPLAEQCFNTDQDEQNGDSSTGGQSTRRKSLGFTSQLRKMNRIRRLLDAALFQPTRQSQPEVGPGTACLSDYAHILHILDTIHERSPTRALLTGFPMLLALRSWCDSDALPQHRRFAVRQVLAGQWQTISRIWDFEELKELTKNYTISPSFPYPPPEVEFPASEQPFILVESPIEDEPESWCGNEILVSSVSKHANIQRATGLDEAVLAQRLGVPWSPDSALRDSVESSINGDSPRPDHGNPLLKISPALMQISNLSLQSLTRSNRGVGVNDLRDALEGRGGMSSVALSQGRAPSIASLGPTHSGASGESVVSPSIWSASRPRTRLLSGESQKDVKNVLDKLGIGSSIPASPLRLSASPQHPRSVLIPPYKG